MTPVFVITLWDAIGLSIAGIIALVAILYGIYILIKRRFCAHDWREDDRSPTGSCRGPIFLHWDCRKCGSSTQANPSPTSGGV